MRIRHLGIVVQDLERTAEFYENVLGFKRLGDARTPGHYPGKALDLPYLRTAGVDPLRVFWPRLTAAEESGLKRGCVVITSGPAIARRLENECSTLIAHAA